MIIYQVTDPELVIATNPKSGVQSTASLLEHLELDFARTDVHEKASIPNSVEGYENRALVFRDPYNRAVSMFLRFCVTLENPQPRKRSSSEAILRALNRGGGGISFREFLTYLLDTPAAQRDLHYRPQHLLPPPHRVVRTEHFKEDMLNWFRSLGYRAGAEALASQAPGSLRKNTASSRSGGMRRQPATDSSVVGSDELLLRRRDGFPTTSSFLNDVTRRMISKVFPEDVAFASLI